MCIIVTVGPEIEYWEESDTEIMDDMDQPIPQDMNESELNVEQKSLIWWIALFVSLFQTLHFIPERAIGWLLHFFSALLRYLGKYSEFIQEVAVAFPSSVYLMNKYMGKRDILNGFHKFVVCPKCHSIYKFEETFDKRGSQYIIMTCHNKNTSDRVCGTPLLRKVEPKWETSSLSSSYILL